MGPRYHLKRNLQLKESTMRFPYGPEARDLAEQFQRIDSDIYGNPRYYIGAYSLPEILRLYRKQAASGLSVYRGRRFGSGYVAQSYNLEYDCEKWLERAAAIMGKAEAGGYQWGPGFAPVALSARPLAWLHSTFSGLVPCRLISAARHDVLGLQFAVTYTGRAAPYAGRGAEAWPARQIVPRAAARPGCRLIRPYDWGLILPELAGPSAPRNVHACPV